MNQIAHIDAALPNPTDALAAFCKAIGDALRLDILRVLRNDSFGVLELAQIFAMRQSGMSHHLKVLANAGLVSTRREGNSIFYRRSLPAADISWHQLHAQLLDNAESMLERARQHCSDAGLSNVAFFLTDALAPQQLPLADCLVCNMVLHHMPAPAEALKRFADLLKPGGSLVLTELCSHDQSWVRDSCGDLWLGFDQDDIARWAQDAGLISGLSQYIGLRNGFQLQLLQLAKPEPSPSEERIHA